MTAIGGPQVQALQRAITIPANTFSPNPATFPINLGDVWCYSVEIQVPYGTAGGVGFFIQYAGTQIVPWGVNGGFMVVDDYNRSFPIDAELGKGLAMIGYNNGALDHTIYTRWLCVPIAAHNQGGTSAPPAPLDLSSLGSG